jgi:aspartyl-tRNA(Asn)/glutamyl-tRNA(Gln) amidotransferase subunit C
MGKASGPTVLKREEVEHIARLAKVDPTEEEKERFRDQLGRILEYFRKIDELELDDVEPTTHTMDVCNVFREDVERESLPPEEVLANAPEREDSYFKAPRVG